MDTTSLVSYHVGGCMSINKNDQKNYDNAEKCGFYPHYEYYCAYIHQIFTFLLKNLYFFQFLH